MNRRRQSPACTGQTRPVEASGYADRGGNDGNPQETGTGPSVDWWNPPAFVDAPRQSRGEKDVARLLNILDSLGGAEA